MQASSQQSDPITLVVSEVVEPDLVEEYEAWTKEINQSAQQFEGFMGVEIICPRNHHYLEYVVIVKFDNYDHYKNWLSSPIYQQWIHRSKKFISKRSQQYLPNGLELWFTLPQSTWLHPPQPAYYKQIIIGVVTVYPLILLANFLLNPLLKELPNLLGLLISVIFVSILLTYPVMPYLTKKLEFWLYPSTPKRVKKRPK